MPTLQTITATDVPAREKTAVALSSLLAATLLTVMKALVGALTGSLGILSEAAHSGLDMVAALVTYLSVRVSDKPADLDHPFGHGKIEHLSAFIETSLLLITCGWIVLEALSRLYFQQSRVKPSVWAIGVMLISIAIDTLRSRALFRVARKFNSQALEADALHFSTDVYSSSVVILGLILVYVADAKNIPVLRNADPIAALVVAAIVVYISMRLGKRTVDALVDAAPQGASDQISKAVSSVPGVLNHERIRVRQSGERLFVDFQVMLESNIPFEHAQSVVKVVEAKVHELFPSADVVIRAAPREPASGDLVARIRSIAHRENFQVHDVTAYDVKGRVNVNLDLELDPGLRLDAAHGQASLLEAEIMKELPEVSEVNIHIEPLTKRVEPSDVPRLAPRVMEKTLMKIARETPGVLDCHAVEAHQVGPSILVSLHATFDPDLPVTRVHEITDELEFKFRKAFPQIFKVSIHAEPKETSGSADVPPGGHKRRSQ
ncbi:MAG TPA: cation-efflux pump [Terriglobia bacterium]|nr:cation-efflux pump [Terriglobia bacterium]